MAYTEILKLLGGIVRWGINGFKGAFSNYYDEKYEHVNFITGIVVLAVFFIISVPLVGIFIFRQD